MMIALLFLALNQQVSTEAPSVPTAWVTSDVPATEQSGMQKRYVLRTADRVFTISTGWDKDNNANLLELEATDITQKKTLRVYLWTANRMTGCGYGGDWSLDGPPTYLIQELMKSHTEGLPSVVVRNIARAWKEIR